MALTTGPDGTPWAFHDLPESAFPVRMLSFSPEGQLVFELTIEPYVAVKVPGYGPGSVRYVVAIFADGQAWLSDDPTCAGTVSGDA